MAFRCGCHVLQRLLLLFISIQIVMGMTIVDDTDPQMVFSNVGPSWWGANARNGQGRLIGGVSIYDRSKSPYKFTWHEVLGDGAFVSMTFTGTRVNLTGTTSRTRYQTTVDIYLDDQYMTRFQTIPETRPSVAGDIDLLVTMADFDNLSPAKHTLKAVNVGADSLFVVDFIAYEPSAAVSISPSSVSSGLASPSSEVPSTIDPGSVGLTISTTKVSDTASASLAVSSNPSSIPGFTSSQSTTSTTVGDLQPVVSDMDVPASDPRIVYSPPEAWSQYTSTRRAMSCLDGTMSSSTANSSLTYNFTGTVIQVYTITSLFGGNYSLSLDGQDQGIYSSYDSSRDSLMCSSRPLYSAAGLANSLHTLVLTVREHSLGSSRDIIQFIGFRVSSTGIQAEGDSVAGPNIAPIVGGVLGGLCGLLFLILLLWWWVRRHRQKEDDTLSSILDPPSPPSLESETWIPYHSGKRPIPIQSHWASPSSQQSPTMPLYPETTYRDIDSLEPSSREQGPIQLPGATGPSNPVNGKLPPSTARRNKTAAHTFHPPEDVATDRLTYYTLPSYHENVMRRAAARNLSQADIDAISRRLTEVIRNQVEQNGANLNDIDGVMPPQELIDHLVEELRAPSSSRP